MESSTAQNSSALAIFFRLTRLQFVPLIVVPALVGSSIAYKSLHYFNPIFFCLMLAGVILLHLGANAIDDCYDFQNGVDRIANTMFPKDFGGWKPLPRGKISLRNAKLISYLLLVASLIFAFYFFFEVGVWSLVLGAAGVGLAIIYTAPPLKLDYRGLGLGELSIFLAFGPIPVLGSYYVQTGSLSPIAFIAAIPIGLLTVTILVDHDLIFFEVYSAARKLSLGAVLGRRKSLRLSLALTVIAYGFVIALAALRFTSIYTIAAPLSGLIVLSRRFKTFGEPSESPPHYVPFALNGMLANWIFGLVFAATILL